MARQLDMPAGRSCRAVTFWLTTAAVGFVLWRAWVSDDAFITFRHVVNCLEGHGPVFNPGERVQAFSHPLWFWLLVAGSVFFDVYAVAIGLGLVFTAAIVLFLSSSLRGQRHHWPRLLAGAVVLLSSRTFVEFQTSGLEASLGNLLVAMLWGLLAMKAHRGPLTTVIAPGWLCALLVLTRPDHVVLCGPIMLALCIQFLRHRNGRQWLGLALAALPVIGWYGFATVYYGTPFPNTAYAKVATPLSNALQLGSFYVWDYCRYEPLHALLIATTIATGLVVSLRGLASRRAGAGITCALTLGLAFHIIYVISVGGDFMRGRFVAPVLVGSVVLAVHLIEPLLPAHDISRPLTLLLAVAGALFCCVQTWTLAVLTCVRIGLDEMQYEALQRPYAMAGAMLAYLGIVLVCGRSLERRCGRRCRLAFVALVTIQTAFLLSLTGYAQPPWGVLAFFGLALTWCSYNGVLAWAGRISPNPIRLLLFGLVVAAAGSLCDVDRPREGNEGTVNDEYSFYVVEGWHNPFRHPTEALSGAPGEWVRLGGTASRYAAENGPTTIAFSALGMTSYHAGSKVHVIDLYGLADAYIARCDRPPCHMMGHMSNDVPESYLRCRGAVNLQNDWLVRLKQRDPDLVRQAKAMSKDVRWSDENAHQRWLAVRRVIAGPLWSAQRWREIPRFIFAERRGRPAWPPGESPVERFGP